MERQQIFTASFCCHEYLLNKAIESCTVSKALLLSHGELIYAVSSNMFCIGRSHYNVEQFDVSHVLTMRANHSVGVIRPEIYHLIPQLETNVTWLFFTRQSLPRLFMFLVLLFRQERRDLWLQLTLIHKRADITHDWRTEERATERRVVKVRFHYSLNCNTPHLFTISHISRIEHFRSCRSCSYSVLFKRSIIVTSSAISELWNPN